MKISVKLNIGFLIACFLPLLAATGYALWYFNGRIEAEANARLDADVTTARLLYDAEAAHLQNIARYIASTNAVRLVLKFELASQIATLLDDYARAYHLSQIAVLTATLKRFPADGDFPHQNYALEGLAEHVTVGTESALTESGPMLALVVGAPIFGRDGTLLGALVLERRLAIIDICEIVQTVTGAQAFTALLNDAGEPLLPDSARLNAVKARSFVLRNAQQTPVGVLVVWRDVRDFALLRRGAILIFTLIGLTTIGLAATLRHVLTRAIVRPILRLKEAAQAMTHGTYTLPTLSGYDEIGELSDAMTTMAARLQRHFEQYIEFVKRAVTGTVVVQNDLMVFCNDAFLKIFDRAENITIGAPLTEVLPDRAPAEFERRGKWYHAQRSEILWCNEPALLLTVQDVTHQKERELVAKRESARLRAESARLGAENARLREAMQTRDRFGKMIGRSLLMQQLYDRLPRIAASPDTVLITGETGTGKGLLARTLHDHSPRGQKPFVPVNCGAVPDTLFEREFFGHVRGAFTGADRAQPGFIDRANSGTLFLDEVGELPQTLQVKLLHLLDGEGYAPVGTGLKKYPDVRVIAATNQNIDRLLTQKRLREDFYYRINVVALTLPPLRKRHDDIPLLAEYFLNGNPAALGADRLLDHFQGYAWPGNVRELKNIIRRWQAGDTDFRDLYPAGPKHNDLQADLEKYERFLIQQALHQAGRNRELAAKLLGISPRNLYRKLKKLNLD